MSFVMFEHVEFIHPVDKCILTLETPSEGIPLIPRIGEQLHLRGDKLYQVTNVRYIVGATYGRYNDRRRVTVRVSISDA